jgi:hypothetical protein
MKQGCSSEPVSCSDRHDSPNFCGNRKYSTGSTRGRHCWPVHPNPLESSPHIYILTIFYEEQKCIMKLLIIQFLYRPVISISHFLTPKHSRLIFFCSTIDLNISLMVRNYDFQQYETTNKIVICVFQSLLFPVREGKIKNSEFIVKKHFPNLINTLLFKQFTRYS